MKELSETVKSIAEELEEKYNEGTLSEYLDDVLDIEVYSNLKHEYLGARILVSFGGPNIWINTRYGLVEGYWGGDHFDYRIEPSVSDELNDCIESLWNY